MHHPKRLSFKYSSLFLLLYSLLLCLCTDDNGSGPNDPPDTDKRVQDTAVGGTWIQLESEGDLDTIILTEQQLHVPGLLEAITENYTINNGRITVSGDVIAEYLIEDDILYIEELGEDDTPDATVDTGAAFSYTRISAITDTGDTGTTNPDDTGSIDPGDTSHPGMLIPKGTPVDYTDESYTNDMVLIESQGKSFEMGLRDSVRFMDYTAQPVHTVSFTYDFYMDKNEVTVEKLAKMLNSASGIYDIEVVRYSVEERDGAYFVEEDGSLTRLLDLGSENRTIDHNSEKGFHNNTFLLNRAASSVTWYGAALYCNMLSRRNGLEPVYDISGWNGENNDFIDYGANGYRLPTEAEWEYACRGGRQALYFWGDNFGMYPMYAYVAEVTVPRNVGGQLPNPFGLFDILGNVAEICNDWMSDDYYKESPSINPTGPQARDVVNVSVIGGYFGAVRRGGGGGWILPGKRQRMPCDAENVMVLVGKDIVPYLVFALSCR